MKDSASLKQAVFLKHQSESRRLDICPIFILGT